MSDAAPRRQSSPIATLRTWSFGIGVVLVLLGGLALARPLAPSLAITFFIGGLLLAGGIVRIVAAFGTRTWQGFWLTLLCGVLSLVSGTAMLAIPVEGVHVLVVFLGLLILFDAAAKLAAAFAVPRDYPWGWLVVDGLITATLGGVLFTATTQQAPDYLGAIIGIHLLVSGVMLLGTWWSLRRLAP